MFKKVIVTLLIFILWIFQVNAYSNTELDLFYQKFITSLEQKNITISTEIATLNSLQTKLESKLKTTKTKKTQVIINYLININSKKIQELTTKLSSWNTLQTQITTSSSISNQKTLLWTDWKYYDISKFSFKVFSINSKSEIVDNWNTYRLSYSKYLPLNSQNFSYLQNAWLTKWYFLIKSDNTAFFVTDYTLEKKYSFKELQTLFSYTADSKNPNNVDWNWNYILYSFSKYYYFDDTFWAYLTDLTQAWITKDKSLMVYNWVKYYFVKDFSKRVVISKDLLQNMSNKSEVLSNLYSDTQNYESLNISLLQQIKSTTSLITSWLTTDEAKISAIYSWIVFNLEYDNTTDSSDYKIYSWLESFKNKSWVCDWYAKLLLYMLSFAWVENSEIKRWYAFDNKDFPDFWHAWVKIWDYYYDPTFDDPIGQSSDYTFSDFKYFKLPHDLMYINRFDWDNELKNYSNLSLTERKQIALKNLYSFYTKYSDYNLVKKIKNRIVLWFTYSDSITLDLVKNKLWYFDLSNWSFTKSWVKYTLASYKYYTISDSNIETVLSIKTLDLNDCILFKFYNGTSYEYRLAYDIIYK